MPQKPPASLREKYDMNTVKNGDDQCWIWSGNTGLNGYGIMHISGRKTRMYAHRAAYMLFVGPLVKGLNVCHSCDVKLCVNPAHLYQATQKQNVIDAADRKLLANTRKTHCRHGHEYNEHNTQYSFKNGRSGRRCRECRKREVATNTERRRLKRAVETGA